MSQVSLEVSEWRDIAAAGVDAFIRTRGGAVVWPEVDAFLASGSWLADNTQLWDADGRYAHVSNRVSRIDPHHLTWARHALQELGLLLPETAQLQGRPVTAWIHTGLRDEYQGTAVARAAAARRRSYRAFLAWTGNDTCGAIAERVVQASLDSLAGRQVWTSGAARGRVTTLNGISVPGGPLDHAGHWAVDPDDPRAGFIPFAVEVKNIRHVVYPRHHEVWDLLAKVGAFPDHIPILITRRVHYWTYQLFAEIGAITHQTRSQWFSPTLGSERFDKITRELGFFDARQVAEPDQANRTLAGFFSTTLRKGTRGDDRSLMIRSGERWQRAAPICAEYLDLRDESLDAEARTSRYRDFCGDLAAAGFDTSGFANLD